MSRFPPMLALALFACAGDSPSKRGPDTATGSATGTTTGATAATAPTENVLIVLADDLGIDKVRSYYPELTDLPQQPTLDALAADGVRFETAWAAPLCSPTRAQLYSGRYNHQFGLGRNVGADTIEEFPLSEVILPEVLEQDPARSWTTGLVGKWHLAGPSGDDHPNLSGFEHFQGSIDNLNLESYFSYTEITDGVAHHNDVYATTRVTNSAIQYIENTPEPWLLVASYHAPHGPTHTPPEDLVYTPLSTDPTVVEQHHAMIEAFDRELGRLLATIDPEVKARTHVIFLGDNGTSGYAIAPPFDAARGKTTAYEHAHRVPLIVTGPAVTHPGTTTEAMAHVVDILPTVLELVGVPDDPAGGTRAGVSLAPNIADPATPGARTHLYQSLFWGAEGPDWNPMLWTIRDRDYKLVGLEDSDNPDAPLEGLFELGEEPFYSEGPLLPLPWTVDQQAARDALSAAREALLAATPFEPLP